MRFIPVDGARLTLLFGGSITAKPRYENGARVEGAQDTTDSGVPLWTVDCMVVGEDDQRAEVVGVVVPSPYRPVLAPLTPVEFESLMARVYVRDGRPAVSFLAEGIKEQAA